ncbi:MAG: TonB-dependent receptor [Pseudomonadota bacterium]|nr:TonB-dependent receptor [Pseudomonadota bacterium]
MTNLWFATCFICAAVAPLAAQARGLGLQALAEMSLEELSRVEITSVSRRPESLSGAMASIFVISADDLRRSGATSLPEALRLAPNLQVARANANGYAISARGFDGSSANKLLVLVDGRSVYSPLFSGVFWDVQGVPLEDVERIEVISGPGGTVWGVNAVNGIINIITKSAHDTRGGLAAAGGGPHEGLATLRWGGSTAHVGASGGDFRVFARYTEQAHSGKDDGSPVDDAGRFAQVGFRVDWGRGADALALHGAAYTGREGQPAPGSIAITGVPFALHAIAIGGADLNAVWTHRLAGGAALTTQLIVDSTNRDNPPQFSDRQQILDLQLGYAAPASDVHDIVWGAEVRRGIDHVTNGTAYFAFLPATLGQTWASAYVQDTIALAADWHATIGTRVERNDYTGAAWLPSLRLGWQPSGGAMLWAAASRTVRAPSRLDRDAYVPAQPPYLLAGGPKFRSETANVFELGYRGQPTESVTMSASIYQSRYDHVHSQEVDPSRTFLTFANGLRGIVNGFEAWATWEAAPSWRLHAGYNRLAMHLEDRPGSNDSQSVAADEGANASRWWLVRTSLDLPAQTEFDATLRHVAALADPVVPSYFALDARIGWRPAANTAVSLVGRNLLGDDHAEFAASATRSVFDRTWVLALEQRF